MHARGSKKVSRGGAGVGMSGMRRVVVAIIILNSGRIGGGKEVASK